MTVSQRYADAWTAVTRWVPLRKMMPFRKDARRFVKLKYHCFSGMPSTPEGAAERGERRRKIRLRFFTSFSFFGHPIFFFADRLCVSCGHSVWLPGPAFPLKLKLTYFI
jgi:hypothetical protein